ncbi:concanavalin A-like lectin/glucanase [Rickenella mellea]|uniref:Concanavalin A-like lectin/glucanase n=1 Tax=Rickenella mellea TaxID=50990 RepID=A0A4Y7PVJ3_9AGAM|nr:concanavalin A-like lectin/glucanase [Rickenella mellea]
MVDFPGTTGNTEPGRPGLFFLNDRDDVDDISQTFGSSLDAVLSPTVLVGSETVHPRPQHPAASNPAFVDLPSRYSFSSFSASARSRSRPGTGPSTADPTHSQSSSLSEVPRPPLPHDGAIPPRDSLAYPPPRSLSFLAGPPEKAKRNPTSNKRAKSTALSEGDVIPKPWLQRKDPYDRIAYLVTASATLLGVVCAALLCFFGARSVPKVGNLCLVMDENFDTFDTLNVWRHEVDLGGFGNGQFEMTTSSPNNSFVRDGVLYIVPTLTSDVIGNQAIFDGYTFNLTDCTNTNKTACGVVSNSSTQTVINPVQSARITTRNSHNIQYGKVEVRARIPKGDWIWPAIWMLPVDDAYGPWPMSGEIDILESRGNDLLYTHQGRGFITSSLNWGPISFINAVGKTFGWWSVRRTDYSDDFHTYVLEWTQDYLTVYVDSPLHRSLHIRFDEPFFKRGNFPTTVQNGTEAIVLENPWAGRGNSAPFDRPFYLIMDVAVGGTNGWFPDGQGSKPWLDGSLTAMYNFAQAQKHWYSTWPSDVTQRGMAIDYVRMYQKC